MGTRNTLRVYLNGELKVSQYGQWDGYFAGQGNDLCRFLDSDWNIRKLVSGLSHVHFMTKEQSDRIDQSLERIPDDDDTIRQIFVNRTWNRDLGVSILYLIAFGCTTYMRTDECPSGMYGLLLNKYDGKEEGNYDLYLNVNNDIVTGYVKAEFHGYVKMFAINELPSLETLTQWDKESAKYEETL